MQKVVFGRREQSREQNPEDESNNNNKKARSRRQSLLPASELHLEVPCFGVRPAGTSAVAQAAESSQPADNDGGDPTELSAHNSCPVPISLAVPANCAYGEADSDVEHESRAGDLVNANVSSELAAILSRAAALIETQQNADGTFTDGSELVTSRLVSRQSSMDGVVRELQHSQQSSSSAVLDVPNSANSSRSVAGRGRIQSRTVAASGQSSAVHSAGSRRSLRPAIPTSHVIDDVMLDVTSQPPATRSAPAMHQRAPRG